MTPWVNPLGDPHQCQEFVFSLTKLVYQLLRPLHEAGVEFLAFFVRSRRKVDRASLPGGHWLVARPFVEVLICRHGGSLTCRVDWVEGVFS